MAITTGGCMKSWPCTHCPRSLCRWHPARREPLPHPAALPLSRSPLCHQPVLRCRSTHFGSVQRDSQLMGNLHIPADLRNHCPLFQTKCDILQTWNMRSLGSCCFHAGVMMMVVSWWFHGDLRDTLSPSRPSASSSERQRSAAFLRASQLPFCRAFSTLSSSGRISASRSRKQWIMGDDNGILSIRNILINNDSIIIYTVTMEYYNDGESTWINQVLNINWP